MPSGIATDYYTQDFFRDLVETQSLVSLYDFENREGLFPGIDNRMKFSLLTIGGADTSVETADFAFFLTNLDQLRDETSHFALSAEDLATINPNTKTCPLFRTERHAELTLKLHESAPVMIHTESETNPWGISFNQMLHMSNDSSLLHTREDFDDPQLDSYNRVKVGGTTYLPVYEDKIVGMYDHRESTIEVTDNVNRSAQPVAISDDAHTDPTTLPEPLYWVDEAEVAAREPDSWPYDWVGTFKRVTSPTNHRTVVGTVIPRVAISYTLVCTHSTVRDPAAICCLYATMWSFPFDFVTRQKLNQPSLPQYVIEQTPTLPPEAFDADLREYIVPRVLELIFTSWHEAAFADDVWDSASERTRDSSTSGQCE